MSPSHWRDPLCSDMGCRLGVGSGMGNSGTGDVAGVSVGDGRSENMMDDGIVTVDDGNETRVPAGDPSDMRMAGLSVVAAVQCVNWPHVFCGGCRFVMQATFGCLTQGGGVSRTVGITNELGAGCWVLSSGYCCWGFWALGSDIQKKHDVGKTGWNRSRHHVDECNLTRKSGKCVE